MVLDVDEKVGETARPFPPEAASAMRKSQKQDALLKLESKRKQARRKKRLIERIANGENLEELQEFVSLNSNSHHNENHHHHHHNHRHTSSNTNTNNNNNNNNNNNTISLSSMASHPNICNNNLHMNDHQKSGKYKSKTLHSNSNSGNSSKEHHPSNKSSKSSKIRKEDLLFGRQPQNKKSKSKKSKKRNKSSNFVVPMKLSSFLEAAEQISAKHYHNLSKKVKASQANSIMSSSGIINASNCNNMSTRTAHRAMNTSTDVATHGKLKDTRIIGGSAQDLMSHAKAGGTVGLTKQYFNNGRGLKNNDEHYYSHGHGHGRTHLQGRGHSGGSSHHRSADHEYHNHNALHSHGSLHPKMKKTPVLSLKSIQQQQKKDSAESARKQREEEMQMLARQQNALFSKKLLKNAQSQAHLHSHSHSHSTRNLSHPHSSRNNSLGSSLAGSSCSSVNGGHSSVAMPMPSRMEYSVGHTRSRSGRHSTSATQDILSQLHKAHLNSILPLQSLQNSRPPLTNNLISLVSDHLNTYAQAHATSAHLFASNPLLPQLLSQQTPMRSALQQQLAAISALGFPAVTSTELGYTTMPSMRPSTQTLMSATNFGANLLRRHLANPAYTHTGNAAANSLFAAAAANNALQAAFDWKIGDIAIHNGRVCVIHKMNFECSPPSVLIQMSDTKEEFNVDFEQISKPTVQPTILSGQLHMNGTYHSHSTGNPAVHAVAHATVHAQPQPPPPAPLPLPLQRVPPALHSSNALLARFMKVGIYDHMKFRQKYTEEIMRGSSVFSCIPCTNDPTNTLLCDAYIMERLYPLKSASSITITELKRDLNKDYPHNSVEVLPIFERAYIYKPCQQYILVQFQSEDSRAFALSLYHKWKEKEETLRIEFVEKWFARSYFLQHAHLYSLIAIQSLITVHHNNNSLLSEKSNERGSRGSDSEQITNNMNKNARHCRCCTPRVIHFPSFDPNYNGSKDPQHMMHDQQCIHTCCCCVFHESQIAGAEDTLKPSSVVLWRGRKCVAQGPMPASREDYRISISDTDNTCMQATATTVPVPISSLQIIDCYTVSTPLQQPQSQNIKSMDFFHRKRIHVQNISDLDERFDQQKWIWDDLTFVLYVKRFWNIPRNFI
jgi:hypothetical protein